MPKVLGPRSLRLRQEEEELRQEEEEDREGGAGSGARNVSVRGSLVQRWWRRAARQEVEAAGHRMMVVVEEEPWWPPNLEGTKRGRSTSRESTMMTSGISSMWSERPGYELKRSFRRRKKKFGC